MTGRIRVLFIALAAATVSGESAFGQMLTSRYSKLNYNYVYGAGGDSNTGNDLIEDPILVSVDTETTGFSNGTSGVLPGGTPYAASVFSDLDQTYSITGPFTAFESITASGAIDIASTTSGAGSALMFSTNPGNELLFNFTVATSVRYRLTGGFDHPNAGVFSGVQLQRFNGFNWTSVFTTFFTPNGSFDSEGTLIPGDYRMHAFIGVNVQGNQAAITSYNYNLTIRRSADMNCDGLVDGRDVKAFVTALLDAPAYETQYDDCERLNGDVNFDDVVTAADIAPFATCVLNGGCQ